LIQAFSVSWKINLGLEFAEPSSFSRIAKLPLQICQIILIRHAWEILSQIIFFI
jgi:hypothetical protein